MTEIDWVVVTAPTNRGSDPAVELVGALAILAARRPDMEFRTAVLGGATPTITTVLDEAAAAGARHVLVQNGQTLGDRKMQGWFRRVIGHWLRTRPDGAYTPEVSIGPPLCDVDSYADALDDALADGGTPASQKTAPLLSPAWEKVPGFTRHVLVCRGPRCSVLGSGETAGALGAAVDDRGLDDDEVLVTHTGCLFPCVQAPVVVVYPDNVWYDGVTPERVDRLVDEHLVGGTPITEWMGDRTVAAPGRTFVTAGDRTDDPVD